jgi:hypothetical protein
MQLKRDAVVESDDRRHRRALEFELAGQLERDNRLKVLAVGHSVVSRRSAANSAR